MANMNRLNPEQLAQAVRDEEISFEDALLAHLNNLGIAVEDVALYFALTLAISLAANMEDQWDETIDLPDGPSSVADIIKRFQLRAFLEN